MREWLNNLNRVRQPRQLIPDPFPPGPGPGPDPEPNPEPNPVPHPGGPEQPPI